METARSKAVARDENPVSVIDEGVIDVEEWLSLPELVCSDRLIVHALSFRTMTVA